jgi:AcrR family transcriptional regulator
MVETPRPKRAYNSSRRQEQSRQTRQQIADAARRMFAERGYARATIEAIAGEAGVAAETIYALFGSKSKILWHLMNISVGGDEESVRVIERPDPQAVLRETDQHKQLQMFAHSITGILERAAPVMEIMRGAAEIEPEIADLYQRNNAERWQNMTMVAQSVAAHGPLRDGVEIEQAIAAIFTLTSGQVFLMLTGERGWSAEQYAEWLADSLIRLLLP